MKQLTTWALGLLMTAAAMAQTAPAPQTQPAVRWFPIYARFAPDDSWVIVNLCSYHNPLYCRLVRWEPDGQAQPLEDGTPTTGHWSLIAGQDPGKSYIWPSVSWNGKKLAYVLADCPVKSQPAPPRASGTVPSVPHPLEKLDCAFYNGQPAMSESTTDLSQGQQIAAVYSATRPAWRPDDQAILYWRTVAKVTLASGKTGGLRDVYEYDFKAQSETPKFDRFATHISWGLETTGPFYAPDGKTFAFCGYGFNFPPALGLQHMIQCVQVNPQNVVDFKGLNPLSHNTTFRWLMEDWQGTHWITNGERVRLVDKKTLLVTDEILNTRLPSGYIGNLKSPNGVSVSKDKNAIFVNQTLFSSQPVRRSAYWIADGRDAPPAPHLSYYDARTREIRPVFWPNVDQLN